MPTQKNMLHAFNISNEALLRELKKTEQVKNLTLHDKLNLTAACAENGQRECLELLLNVIVQDVTPGQESFLIGEFAIKNAAENGHKKCLELLLDTIKDITTENKIYLIGKHTIDHITDNDQRECLELLLDTIQDITTENKIYLIGEFSIRSAARNGYKECLELLLNFIKDFPIENKVKLLENGVFLNVIKKDHIESLKLLLGAISGITPEKQAKLIGKSAIYYASLYGNIECLKELLDFIKDFSIENKVQLIGGGAINNAASNGHIECIKILLNYIGKIPDIAFEHKSYLIGGEALDSSASNGHKECELAILNFLIESDIIGVKESSLWQYYIDHNLETKDTYKLWVSTKHSYDNIHEINNRLLANENLKLKFFTDICCFMRQNGKIIDIAIIGLPDVVRLLHGEKGGYQYKIFDILSLSKVMSCKEKIEVAISILTMDSVVKNLLISIQHKEVVNENEMLRKLEPSILLKITSHFLKDDESLVKLLSTTHNTEEVKNILLNPMKKLNELDNHTAVTMVAEEHLEGENTFQAGSASSSGGNDLLIPDPSVTLTGEGEHLFMIPEN